MDWTILRKRHGLTLIELFIVLGLSSILIAAIYRTFLDQQKTYAAQEQVADMQQNVRVAISQITREIRMAGYGKNILKPPSEGGFGSINGFTSLITPGNNANNVGNNDDVITVIFADEVGTLTQDAYANGTQLHVSDGDKFNSDKKKYLCLEGEYNYAVQDVSGNAVTLTTPLLEGHREKKHVFLVKAVTYKLRWDTNNPTMPVLVRDENTGGGSQVIAENVENLQVQYTLKDGAVTDSPAIAEDVRIAKVAITVRTEKTDPQLGGDGYRRRVLASNIKIRNLGL